MKEKQIRKVTLSSEGLKGLIIEGTLETVKENRIAINGFKDTVKHPIHLDLEEKIRDLRLHALTIAGLITDNTPKSEKSSLISSCNVLSFEVGEDYFVLKVESRVFDTKYIKFSTPRVDSSDGYEYFEIVNQLLRDILIEVHAYMKGMKKIKYVLINPTCIGLQTFKKGLSRTAPCLFQNPRFKDEKKPAS
jgi:hypothetical protein